MRKWNSSEPIVRTVSALDAVLANNGDDAGRRLLNFIHIVCNESNSDSILEIGAI